MEAPSVRQPMFTTVYSDFLFSLFELNWAFVRMLSMRLPMNCIW